MVWKRIVSLFLVLIFAIMAASFDVHTEENYVTVYINGVLLETDVPAQIIDDRTMVPLRAIFERMYPGIDLMYSEEVQIITAKWEDGVLEMKIDRDYIHLNNIRIDIPVPPRLVDDRVFVPIIVIVEVFGAETRWNPEERVVDIVYNTGYSIESNDEIEIDYSRATIQQLTNMGYSVDEISNLFAYQLYTLINNYRVSHRQHKLVWLENLAKACKLHAEDMDVNKYFSHTSLNADKVEDRAAAQGYTATVVEGIATFTGDDSPTTIAHRWYNTTRQRDTMLQYQWLHYGVGLHFSVDEDGKVEEGSVVQIFGRGDF